MKNNILFSKKMIIITIVATVVIMALLGYIKLNNIVVEREIKESFEIVNEIDRYFDNKIAMANFVTEAVFYRDFLENIGTRESYRMDPDYPKVIEDLNSVRDIDGRILNVFLSSVKLEILITHDEWDTPIDYDIDKREWYIELLKSDGTDISTPYIDAITGEYIITVSKAIYNDTGELLGSLGLDIKVADIGSIISNYTLMDKVVIMDKSGDVILNSLGSDITNVELARISNSFTDDKFKSLELSGKEYSIHHLDNLGWYLIILSGNSGIFNTDIAFIIIYLMVVFIVALIILYLYRLNKNIVRLSEVEMELSKNLDSTKSLRLKSKGDQYDGLTEILNLYIEKNENVSDSYEEKLNDKDEQINRSISVLTEIESKILESDSLAEMGNIIADIAHEVNTPLGNSIMGVSYIKTEVKNLKNIEPEYLEEAIQNMEKSIEFTETGLKKTAKLIDHFKKVVNSEKYNKKVDFNIKYIIEEVVSELIALYPKLSNYDIDVSCDGDISIYDNPDAYKEIFKNLIENSLIHGYEGKDFGKISVFLTKDNNDLVIIYDDDGNGMDKDISSKVFKPFFSTKRSEGHLGLGMFIVYNIVESRCKGKIICDSHLGSGTEYKIRIPALRD